jgi:hypothetical protein
MEIERSWIKYIIKNITIIIIIIIIIITIMTS